LAYTTSNANPQNCVSCHQTSVNAWLTSDHAKAMDIATPKTVLGNFNNIEAAHYSQTARFYKQENKLKTKPTYTKLTIPLVIIHFSNI